MRFRDTAAGFAAGVAVAGFGHPNTIGRRALYYARRSAAYKRPAHGGLGAMGDSLTIGTSHVKWGLLGADSWLAHVVRAGVPYCYNAALPEQTTEWMALRLHRDLLSRRPTVVVILAGTNDLLCGLPLDRPLRLVASMAEECEAHGARAVIGTLPPIQLAVSGLFVSPTVLADYNGALRDIGPPVIDFYAATSDGDGYRLGLSDDGIHPSTLGAKAMAAAALPTITRVLRARGLSCTLS